MGLNIKNEEVERLAAELARFHQTSKTDIILQGLRGIKEADRKKSKEQKMAELWEYLEKEVWPFVPAKYLGKGIPQEEQDEILGYGPNGYPE